MKLKYVCKLKRINSGNVEYEMFCLTGCNKVLTKHLEAMPGKFQ
jgi:hypothetical protein